MKELKERALNSQTRFKAHYYDVAIRSVEAHPLPITSGLEMTAFPGIGVKTAEKIQEVIDTVYTVRTSD